MCTITIVKQSPNQLLFTMNRDEQKKRPIATELRDTDDLKYPVDPSSNGSWISLHKCGVIMAVMNFYPESYHDWNIEKPSRGKIVVETDKTKLLKNRPQKFEEPFHPFRLFRLDNVNDQFEEMIWDGKKALINEMPIPQKACFVSSSYKPNETTKYRVKLFESLQSYDENEILKLHTSFGETPGLQTFWVEREKVKTVSLTQILLKGTTQRLDYQTDLSVLKNQFQ